MEHVDITDKQSFRKLEILETLRLVIDPELEINIIEMGLVYDVKVEEDKKSILIKMTLSSPNCPMGATIVAAVENCLQHHFPHYTPSVNLVWEPAWSFDLITDEGKRLLGL
jgi:metal-sulfur cluster biosynthetic enzyme